MNNYKILLLSSVMAISLIWLSSSYLVPTRNLQPNIAIAQNENNIIFVNASPSTTSATTDQQANSGATSRNLSLIEHDKPTHAKIVIVNATPGLQGFYSGNGIVKGIKFSANGTVLIVPRSEGGANLSGQANITTANGEKGDYNFHSVGHVEFAKEPIRGNIKDILANGPISTNGSAYFHTNSSGELGAINNLVVSFKERIDVLGRSTIEGWESK